MSHNALPAGTILNSNLLVNRVLGQGGFGITYLVHDNDLQQDLVLKEFFPMELAQRVGQQVIPLEEAEAQTSFAHYLRRFLEEARLAAKIDHPNLVKVNRFFAANGTGYFAMPWQQGETLEQLLKREGKLAPQAAVDLIDPLLDGLEKLHAAGLVHRDVKPANIYLRSVGGPLLIDFGTARAPASTTGPLTTILSPGYAPLEQYTEDRVQGPHTDVYAVGAVLYLMLTGCKPLDALARYTSEGDSRKYVPCRDAAPASVPLPLREVIDKAMTLQVEGRIPDAPSLRRALHAALRSVPEPATADTSHQSAHSTMPPTGGLPRTGAEDPPPTVKSEGSRLVLAGIAAVVLVSAAATVRWWPEPQPQETSVAMPQTAPPAEPPNTGVATEATGPATPVLKQTPVGVEATSVAIQTDGEKGGNKLALTEDMVQKVRKGLPQGDLAVTVTLDPPHPKFIEGEFISIGFSTKENAYAAVFVYSQDGSVTMLYPNDYAKGRLVKANVVNWVGSGDQKFRIQVVPPFGTDLIHVVAFRNADDFKLLLDVLEINKATKELFVVDRVSLTRSVETIRTRGLAVVPVGVASQTASAKGGWGDAVANLTTQAR